MKHQLCTKRRTWNVSVTETDDRIILAITCCVYGPPSDDLEEFKAWLRPLIVHYDKDPRPFEITNQFSGEVATVFGDSDSHVAFIEQRKDVQ